MHKLTIKILNEVKCSITGLLTDHLRELYNIYGIEKKGAKFMPKFKMGLWDGKIRFFSTKGETYTRLLPDIVDYLEATGCYEIDLIDDRNQIPFYQGEIDENFMMDTALVQVKLRDYQVEMVNLCLKETSGFLESCTGSGKTLTCAALAKALYQLNQRTIIIVPSGDLVEQTAETFEMCGLPYGTYSGGSKNLDPPITVATWQALQYAPEILRKYNAFIVDECHTLTGQVLKDLINEYGGHIGYRFGVTGTFPPDEVDKFACHASIGQILYQLPAWKLIEAGYLAKIRIQPVEIQDKKKLNSQEFPDFDIERKYLTTSQERLELIAEDLQSTINQYGNSLILVGDVEQGKRLQQLIPNSTFLYGDNKIKERQRAYKRFEEEDDVIVIATMKIASTGISINRIFFLGLVDINKSFTKVIQAIGRGLRKAHDKDEVFAKDYYSSLKYSKKHFSSERKKFYTEARYPIEPTIKIKHRS